MARKAANKSAAPAAPVNPNPAEAGNTDVAALMAQVAALKAENESLKSLVSMSEKGAISLRKVGGRALNRMASFYLSEWLDIFARREEVEGFIAANLAECESREAATREAKAAAKASKGKA